MRSLSGKIKKKKMKEEYGQKLKKNKVEKTGLMISSVQKKIRKTGGL